MYVELTPSEIRLAEKLIPSLEERGRLWLRFRWALLAFSAGMMALLPFVFSQPARPPVTPDLMRLYAWIRSALLFLGGVGAVLLCVCLRNWEWHVRDSLIAKVLKEKLHDDRTAKIRASMESRDRRG